MLRGQRIVVDTINNRAVDVRAARRRDDHFLGAAFDVLAGRFAGPEQAGAFEHDVDTELAPRQLGGIAFGEHLDTITVHNDIVAVDLDRARKIAVGCVVARQVRVGVCVAQVVQGDNVVVSRTT